MTATSIDVAAKKVSFKNSEDVHYDTILSSIPLPELVKLIPDTPTVVKEAASRLKTNSVLIVNLGIKKPNISEKNWIYYLDKKYSFIRVSFPSNQSDYVAPEGCSSIWQKLPLAITTLFQRPLSSWWIESSMIYF